MADSISFMAFLDFPDPFPDSRTIWLFKQRIAESGKDELIWSELQRQLGATGLQIKRGTIQDATFIEADTDSSNKSRGKDDKTRRSRDGTWAKKGDETHFGYKLHQKNDIDYCLMRESRQQPHQFTIAKFTSQQKTKSFSEIGDILVLKQ